VKRISFLVIVIFLVACEENDVSRINALVSNDDVGVERADSVHLLYKEGAYTRAEISARTVKRYIKTQNKLEFSDGLEVKFYDSLKLVSVLTADFAVNDDTKQSIFISGNVRMENFQQEVLETQELNWDIRNKKIQCSKGIKIKTPDDVITGTGLDSDEDFSNYTIRQVHGVVAYDEEEDLR
jgi:LPS export ABC transporter protein LptC